MKREAKQQMEKLTLSTKEHGGTWFGVLIGNQNKLLSSSFSKSQKSLVRHLRADAPGSPVHDFTSESNVALTEMIELYEGRRTPNKVRLDWEGVSEFEKSVCQVMREIPKGKVASYGMIAKRIHSAPRAVGTGVARNPWPLFVPCHRVVPASLEIGNYSIGGALSDYGCEVKRDLLEREGVSIEGDRISSRAVWIPAGA
ncbi:MGMT family protein [Candidatus Bathyarchaeota archaeon]|nr:MAG: MGMT family protein [Candidatus Bathyarchaeota archaeon]